MNIDKNPEFLIMFWNWFDSLSKDQKSKFWYYPIDLAMVNYYNTQYKYYKNNK